MSKTNSELEFIVSVLNPFDSENESVKNHLANLDESNLITTLARNKIVSARDRKETRRALLKVSFLKKRQLSADRSPTEIKKIQY